jgi:hypothetical protein
LHHAVTVIIVAAVGSINGLIVETARQMREFADFYGFEFRAEDAFDFKQFVNEIHLQKVAALRQ